MKKRTISILLSLLLVIGLIPLSAFTVLAAEEKSVYITISEDGQFYSDNDDKPVAYREVSLADVASVDLSSYGLDKYSYDGDSDGTADITALHLFIYVHENIMGESWDDVSISGSAGSIYFAGGLFGFEDENLMYYYNGAYPEIEPGWGATADQIVLSDGDFFDVAHYSSWSFYADSAAGFHYFVDSSNNVTHQYTAQAGAPTSIKLERAGGGMFGDGDTVTFESGYPIKYGKSIGTELGTVTTGESGSASITFDNAGIYYVWCDGAEGIDAGVGDIVSSPASAAVIVSGDTDDSEDSAAYQPILNNTLAQLAVTVSNPTFGTGGGEWSVLSLARGGYFAIDDPYFETYYSNVEKTVPGLAKTAAGKGVKEGGLDKNKSTENSRLILALAAIDKDPTNVGGVNVLGAYDTNGFTWIKKQGINGPIFALIALDTRNYPTTDTTLRQQCVDFILSKELANGGWALNGTEADPDITSMALQALVKYKDQKEVAEAAGRAFTALSNMQQDNGGFASWGSVNSESIAQVITACSAWGIDADKDSRFVKENGSALDALLTFYIPEGKGFAHVLTSGAGYTGGEVNGMATDQASYALVAYDRFVNGKTALYDMSDVGGSSEIGELTATLTLPEKVENKAGSAFNAVVNLTGFIKDCRLMDCIINVPGGVSVTDVTMGSRIGGGVVSYHLDSTAGKLRVVYCDPTGGKPITDSGTTYPLELMTIGLKLDETLTNSQISLSISGMSMKKTSDATTGQTVVDTTNATASTTLATGSSYTVMELYTGDDVDLIPSTKKAIAIAVTGIDDGVQMTYEDETGTVTLYYNKAVSEKTKIPTYIAMVDSTRDLTGFVNGDNYSVGAGNATDTLTFGDTDNNGVINAQDALNDVNLWLRQKEIKTDKDILAANVTGDSRINTCDVLGLIENFVDGSDFAVVNLAATAVPAAPESTAT